MNKIKLFSLLITVVTMNCMGMPGANNTNATTTVVTGASSSFSTVSQEFDTRCVKCHGPAGAGPFVPGAVNIARLTSVDFTAIRSRLTGGSKNGSVTDGNWIDSQLDAFTRYIINLGETPVITLSSTNITINATTTTVGVVVTLVNVPSATATVDAAGSHCTLPSSKISGDGSFSINLSANTTNTARNCIITLSGTNATSVTYTITQTAN